jgi:hypothetical protein
MMTSRKMLGLAATERSISAVEIGLVHGRQSVLHAAEFPMPEGDAARDPAVLGKALRQFLKQNRFSCSRCVIGLGTRWLAAREKLLPPTSADLVAGVLSLAAEREFASDPKDLALDYTKPVDLKSGNREQGTGNRKTADVSSVPVPGSPFPVPVVSVLLVAAPRRTVEHLLATAETAGLTVTAVTSSTMALASATGGAASLRRLVLYLSSGGAELCVQAGGGFPLLRSLPMAAPPATAGSGAAENWLNDLAGELRRVLTLLPGASASPQGADLVIWNAAGLSTEALRTLGDRLSLEARACTYPSDLGLAGEAAAPAGESAAAAALALAGLQSDLLAVDFLHSRLTPRKRLALGRKVVWAVGLAAAVVIGCLALLVSWQSQQREVADLTGQRDDMQASVDVAKDMIEKMTFARQWYDQRPRFLDSLRELTLAFPAEGRIWTTSLGIGEDMRALLSGKASDEGAVLEVLDHLTKSPKFSDVKPLYIREVGGGSSEVSFAISLKFVKAD